MTLATAHPIIGCIVIVAMFVGVMGSFLWLFLNANKVHNELDLFKNRAKIAHPDQLYAIRKELVDYAKKHCFHRHLTAHANEVLSFIDGSISALQRVDWKE